MAVSGKGSRDDILIRQPSPISRQEFTALLQFGGFPEPYLTATTRFYNRWRRLRTEQLFREDLRDLSKVQLRQTTLEVCDELRWSGSSDTMLSTVAQSLGTTNTGTELCLVTRLVVDPITLPPNRE